MRAALFLTVSTSCKLFFNLKNREPINLKCCDETASLDRVETRMMKSQSKEPVIKEWLGCSFCHSDHCAPEVYERPIKLAPNKQAKKQVQDRLMMP